MTAARIDLIRGDSLPGTEGCRYAFFPGCCLCENEPEITVKLYDSLRFQNLDTAIFIKHCGDTEEISAEWTALGKPEIIVCCPRCAEVFANSLPEIPVVSVHEKFMEYGISGGCNSTNYCLHSSLCGDSARNGTEIGSWGNLVKSLAEDMGTTVRPYKENSPYPYLVGDIKVRNELKNSGHDAAHILEFIFGMGDSNTHLIHEHEHDHEHGHKDDCAVCDTGATDCKACDGDHDSATCYGNCAACSGCSMKASAPSPLPDKNQRQANREELVQVIQAMYWGQ